MPSLNHSSLMQKLSKKNAQCKIAITNKPLMVFSIKKINPNYTTASLYPSFLKKPLCCCFLIPVCYLSPPSSSLWGSQSIEVVHPFHGGTMTLIPPFFICCFVFSYFCPLSHILIAWDLFNLSFGMCLLIVAVSESWEMKQGYLTPLYFLRLLTL